MDSLGGSIGGAPPPCAGALSRVITLAALERSDGAPAAHGAAIGSDPYAARPP